MIYESMNIKLTLDDIREGSKEKKISELTLEDFKVSFYCVSQADSVVYESYRGRRVFKDRFAEN